MKDYFVNCKTDCERCMRTDDKNAHFVLWMLFICGMHCAL